MQIQLRRLRTFDLPGFVIPLLAVALALLLGAALIAISAISPIVAYRSLLHGAFGSVNNLAETFVKMAPLLLAGLGVAIAFRAKVFNIGAEGQIYMGALGAAFVGLFLGDLRPVVGIPLTLISGFTLGAIWAGIAGILKQRLQANEIIVTLMMNYIAIEIVNYLISGPWRDPAATEPFTSQVAQGTRLPVLISATRLHAGFIIAIVVAVVLWWLMRHTVFGYQLTMLGANDKAAAYGGINTGRLILITMFLSGGLAGLAGVGEVSGLHHRLLEGLSPGYGYTAIAIALLGREKPLGVLLASFLFAALVVGADGMQRATGVPIAVVLIIEGMVLLFVMGSEFLLKRNPVVQNE